MTILQLIMRFLGLAAQQAPDLEAELKDIKARFPDAAPQVDRILGVLATSVSDENLLSVGPDVVGAIFDIARGRFKPVKGAGDGI